jgi:hypothetical protein
MWAQFYGVADIKQWAEGKIDELTRSADVLAESECSLMQM